MNVSLRWNIRRICARDSLLYVYRPCHERTMHRSVEFWEAGRTMVDKRDALIREVDEELRREQLAKLWDRYGLFGLAAAALIVVGVGGYKLWEARQIAAAEAAGARYEAVTQLLAQGKTDDALQEFEAIAKNGPRGYGTLARLQLAGNAARAGKTAEALAAYEALAKDTSVDPLLGDFAKLQAAALILETADWTEMQNRLTPLTGEKNAWRFSARELLGLAAYRAGKLDDAKQVLVELLAEPDVPASIGERARMLMGMITAAALAKGGATAVEPTAAPGKMDAPPAVETKQ
jgi:hypothetical protein